MASSRTIKWIKRILLSLLGLIIVIFITAYILLVTHRKDIQAKITDMFNSNLSGRLEMKDIDFTIFEHFPSLTIRIEDITVSDSASAARGDTLLQAAKISIGVDLPSLFIGSIQFNTIDISDASIYLVKDRNGQMNTPKSRKVKAQTEEKKKEGAIPSMKKILLKNVAFRMVDSVKNKSFGFKFIKTDFKPISGDGMAFRMTGSIHIDGLVFNPVKGGYMTDQDVQISTNISFNPESKLLTVSDGTLIVKDQKLAIKARMDFEQKTMNMQFDAESILPSVAYGILTPAISEKLSAFQLEKPLMTRVIISGSITPGSKPAADVYFKSAGNKLTVKDLRSFENLELLGWFTNHIDSTKINDDHNSRVALPVFRGTVYGLPIESMILVTDLIDLNLLMDAHVAYDEKKLGELTTKRFRFMRGMFSIDFLFNGPLMNYIDTVNKVTIGDLSGMITFNNTEFDQLSTGYQFRNVNGHMTFKKPDLLIDSISMSMNGNQVKLTGNAKYVIAFLLIPSVKAEANLNLTADTIDLNSFQPPPDKTAKEPAAKEPKKDADIASLVNWIASGLEFDINLSADKVIYKRFEATAIKAHLVLNDNQLQIHDAGMNTSGGTFLLNMSVSDLSSNRHGLQVKTSVTGARINDLFYSFDDFNQQAITHKNITGTLFSNATLSATINDDYSIIGSTMNGTLSTKIKNGSLKDVGELDKISKYVFKNRDFSNIEFADIRNRSTLVGTEFDIDTLNVFSSVITLFISGKYDFNKVNTNMLVTIPFSNLKGMEASERMALSDSAARKGGNVTLRATNAADGSLKVAPVVFGKKKKEKS